MNECKLEESEHLSGVRTLFAQTELLPNPFSILFSSQCKISKRLHTRRGNGKRNHTIKKSPDGIVPYNILRHHLSPHNNYITPSQKLAAFTHPKCWKMGQHSFLGVNPPRRARHQLLKRKGGHHLYSSKPSCTGRQMSSHIRRLNQYTCMGFSHWGIEFEGHSSRKDQEFIVYTRLLL